MYVYIYIYSFGLGPSPYKLHKISQDVQAFLHNTELLMQVVPQPMTSSMASSMGVPSCTICGRAGQLNSCTNGIQLWLREKTGEPLVGGAITILISPREWERTANGGWNGLIYQYWLVVQCAHLEKWWSSSMGRMTSLFYEMDNKRHVWNHQPVIWFPVDVPLNQCNWQW